jgi:xanthine dehydrogenase YagS FAD-binding subunit
MRPFEYVRVSDADAVMKNAAMAETRLIAGGTNVVDLMKLGVEHPRRIIDVNALPLAQIEVTADGLSIGAMVRNSELAHDPRVIAGWPVLSEALLSGASPQLRNMATVAGNVLQRTRCVYFRDIGYEACNKRNPGKGCAAMDGWTRMHAILGTSDRCIATNPSDMNVALVALDATVHVRGPSGERAVPIADFHTLPGEHPEIESVLAPGDLITHVTVPNSAFAKRSRYVKVRDRASFAFALASCAVALELDGRNVKQARVALGGVGTKPWRSREAEQVLAGKTGTPDVFRAAADAALRDAKPRKENTFKVELAKRTIVRALTLAGGAA